MNQAVAAERLQGGELLRGGLVVLTGEAIREVVGSHVLRVGLEGLVEGRLGVVGVLLAHVRDREVDQRVRVVRVLGDRVLRLVEGLGHPEVGDELVLVTREALHLPLAVLLVVVGGGDAEGVLDDVGGGLVLPPELERLDDLRHAEPLDGEDHHLARGVVRDGDVLGALCVREHAVHVDRAGDAVLRERDVELGIHLALPLGPARDGLVLGEPSVNHRGRGSSRAGWRRRARARARARCPS